MPKTEAQGLVAPSFKALLAMLLGLYASVTARLESFVSLTNEIFDPLSLWQDLALTTLRCISMFASYFQCVKFFKDTVGLEEMAAAAGAIFVSVVFAAACSLPFEYVMIQINKMQPNLEGKYPYTGFVDCAVKTFKAGGVLKFYTGFPLHCARISPHLTISCIILNQLLKW